MPTLTVCRSEAVVLAIAPRPSPVGPVLLRSVVPNPLSSLTTITYSLSTRGPVHVGVWDVRGRRVVTLVNETRPAGENRVVWEGRDEYGRLVASGIYFVRVRTQTGADRKKITFLR